MESRINRRNNLPVFHSSELNDLGILISDRFSFPEFAMLYPGYLLKYQH